jgi:hypothetical protein
MALPTDGIDYSGTAFDKMSTSAIWDLGVAAGVTQQLLDVAFDTENPRGTLIQLIRARVWRARTLGHGVDRDQLVPLPRDAAVSNMMGRDIWNGVKATPSIQCVSKGPSTAVYRAADAAGYKCEARGCLYKTKNGSCVCRRVAADEHPQPPWPSGVSGQKAYIFVDVDAISAATSTSHQLSPTPFIEAGVEPAHLAATEFWPEPTSTEAAVVDIVAKLSLLTVDSAAVLSAFAAVADDTYILSDNAVNATQVKIPTEEPLPEIVREMGGFDASFDSRYRLLLNMGQATHASTLQASY